MTYQQAFTIGYALCTVFIGVTAFLWGYWEGQRRRLRGLNEEWSRYGWADGEPLRLRFGSDGVAYITDTEPWSAADLFGGERKP